MGTIVIDAERCIGCGQCASSCLLGLVTLENGRATVMPEGKMPCIGCGHCVAACPEQLITLDGEGPVGRANVLSVTPENLALLMKSRRSVRRYQDGPVPDERLRFALDAARYAPTAVNRQAVSWTVINGRQKMEELIGVIHTELDASLKDMSLVELFRTELGAGRDLIFRQAPCAVFNHADRNYELSTADCTAALTYLELLLPTLGIGATWAGFAILVLQHSLTIRRYLGIPDDQQVFAGLFMGLAGEDYPNIPPRKPLQVTYL